MTSGSDDFFLTLNVWSFKSRHVELGTFEIPVVGGVYVFKKARSVESVFIFSSISSFESSLTLTSRVETAGWKIVRRPGFEVDQQQYF